MDVRLGFTVRKNNANHLLCSTVTFFFYMAFVTYSNRIYHLLRTNDGNLVIILLIGWRPKNNFSHVDAGLKGRNALKNGDFFAVVKIGVHSSISLESTLLRINN